MFVSQVSAGEKGRPKTVAGWIEIAAGDKDARRRAVWLTEKERWASRRGLPTGSGRIANSPSLNPEAARRLALAAEALEEG